jgi:hypothetical protein
MLLEFRFGSCSLGFWLPFDKRKWLWKPENILNKFKSINGHEKPKNAELGKLSFWLDLRSIAFQFLSPSWHGWMRGEFLSIHLNQFQGCH